MYTCPIRIKKLLFRLPDISISIFPLSKWEYDVPYFSAWRKVKLQHRSISSKQDKMSDNELHYILLISPTLQEACLPGHRTCTRYHWVDVVSSLPYGVCISICPTFSTLHACALHFSGNKWMGIGNYTTGTKQFTVINI